MNLTRALILPAMFAAIPGLCAVVRTRAEEKPAADVTSIVTLFELVIDADPDTARDCLAVLTTRVQSGEIAGRQLEALRPRLQETLEGVLRDDAHPLYLDAALLSATWKDRAGLKAVQVAFADTELAAERRLAALTALVAAGERDVLTAVDQALRDRERNPAEFRGQALAALGRLDDPRVADVVLGRYGDLEPELRPRAVELLTQRVAWGRRLLEAVGRDEVPASALNFNQVRQLLSLGDEELAAQVRERWGVVREGRHPQREQVIAEMRELIRNTSGDPFAGEQVFKKACGQCHKIYGEGADVGPDITSNGRGSFEQLLSNVFDPSLVIGAAYQAHTVVTADGRVLTGLLVEDSPQRLVLKVQGGKLETVPRDDVEVHKPSEVSMMPEGLETQLTGQEIADLFAFLTLDRHPGDPEARKLPTRE